jgi:hypothetical protein
MGAEFSVEHPVMADPANQSHRPWPALTRFPCFASIPWVDPIRENQVKPPRPSKPKAGAPGKTQHKTRGGCRPFRAFAASHRHQEKSSYRDRHYLPCRSAANFANSLPEVSFLAVPAASDVSIAFVIVWGRRGRRINCPP